MRWPFAPWGHTARRKSSAAVWLTCWCLLLLKTFTDARRDDLIVHTEKGLVQGFRHYVRSANKFVNTFLGIPFAKEPTGRMRFRHPVPLDPWTGIINATKAPNSCYQEPDKTYGDFRGSTMWNPTTPVSEDCLYLNVWVPKGERRTRKSAVLVWIYGGGFYSGTSTLNCYDGKVLAAQNNIIVVSINYRVGVLGFLSLDHPHAPGNAGLFDQLMGLEWVQQNIKHFGGDPQNVTIFGESAGSVSVSLHLLSPLSQPKFQRAILQSGTANMPWATVTPAEGRRRSMEFAIDYLGCPKSDDLETIITCLNDIPPHKLVQNQWVSRGTMQFPFLPVIDGSFLTESPQLSLERKNFKKCPVLMGSNLNEGSWFVIYDLFKLLDLENKSMSRSEFLDSMRDIFLYYPQYPRQVNDIGLNAIRFQYSDFLDPENEDRNLAAIDASVSECHFVCHVNKFAEAYANVGENVYMYYFTHRYSSNPWPEWMGVLHGDEILFTFGDPLRTNSKDNYIPEEVEFSEKVMAYWTNFAKSGDPNRWPGRPSLDDWPLHTPVGKEYLELNSKFLKEPDKKKAIGRGPRTNACAFWNDYLPNLVAATDDYEEEEEEFIEPEEPEVEPTANFTRTAGSTSAGLAVRSMDATLLVLIILLAPSSL